jgi:predicted phosphodiesterase
VLEDVRRAEADQVVVGGDVLPGPMPLETIRCLLSLDVPVQFIQGNGDREVLARRGGADPATLPEPVRDTLRWTARQLQPEDEQLLATWPETLRIRVDGLGETLFCHATPRNDTDIFTRLTSEDRLLPLFAGLDAALVVCGHTHMPFDRMIGQTRVVNAGSVGMPFGRPGADWLLLGPGVELRHTTYDLAAAAARIRGTTYPQAEDFAARYVLQAPSERETLELYARAEVKG